MFTKFISPYFHIFYFCGQSPFNPIENTSQIMRVTVAVSTAIITAIFVLAIFSQYCLAPFYGVTDICLACLFIVSELVTILSVYYQNRLYGHNLQVLWKKLEDTEKLFQRAFTKAQYSITFQRLYVPKFVINIILIVVHCFVKYMVLSPYTHVMVQSSILLLQAFSMLVNLHMLFYITIFQNFLATLTTCIEDGYRSGMSDLLYTNYNALIDFLIRCKVIHFKLWDAIQICNEHFGWTLAAICIQNFMDVTYALYWMFLYIQSERDAFLTIRNYFSVSFFNILYINN